ncbi:MAG: DUF2662 domain-containing protein [Acidimicrobiia bacterium]|nr:DUF2662 domain-containing protein [Acidimicrobiia bacterium]
MGNTSLRAPSGLVNVANSVDSSPMAIARNLEQRLEKLLVGLGGSVSRGEMHPAELAGWLARQADLAGYTHSSGPAVANRFDLTMNPAEIGDDPQKLANAVAEVLGTHAAESGWRLEGPIKVVINTDKSVRRGAPEANFEIEPGPLPDWGRLVGKDQHQLTARRSLVGRGSDCDVMLDADSVSRHHAVIFQKSGDAWVSDLDSTNGTWVNGSAVGGTAVQVTPGSVIMFARASYRYEILT